MEQSDRKLKKGMCNNMNYFICPRQIPRVNQAHLCCQLISGAGFRALEFDHFFDDSRNKLFPHCGGKGEKEFKDSGKWRRGVVMCLQE